MKKFLLSTAIVSAAFAASVGASSAASLDDVMSELKSIRRDNEAMRKEIATLRQNNAQATRQVASPANAPSRALPPNVSTAMAADLPASRGYYKAMPVEGPYNWTGFYAGLNAGYAYGDETTSISTPAVFASGADVNGFFGGGQIGYNLQLGNIVLGVEGDIQYANIASPSHIVIPPPGALLASNKVEAFGTARARIGYAFDRVLVYGTGGFAAGQNSLSISLAGDPLAESRMHTGWAAGGGIEYGIRDGWSVKAEYLHVDLGSQDYLPILSPSKTSVDLQFDLVRAGVNYRF